MQLLLNIINKSQYIYIFGTPDLSLFVSCLVYGYIGMLIRILIDVHKRNPNTAYSPIKFSWSYFWSDNATRFILNIILVALAVRFIPDPNFLGKPLTAFGAFMVGFGSDYLAQQLKNKEKAFLGDTSADTDTVTTIKGTAATTTITTQPVTPVAQPPEVVTPNPVTATTTETIVVNTPVPIVENQGTQTITTPNT